MGIEINKGEFNMDSDIVNNAIKKTLQALQDKGVLKVEKEIQISVAAVSPGEIKRINKEWRDVDEETDVLSFCYDNTVEKLEGEIILCVGIIADNAKKDGISFNEELVKNVVHSVLHINGYIHGEEMFSLQERILNGSVL